MNERNFLVSSFPDGHGLTERMTGLMEDNESMELQLMTHIKIALCDVDSLEMCRII